MVLYIVKINQKKFLKLVLSFFSVTSLLYWCQGKKAQDKGRSTEREKKESKQERKHEPRKDRPLAKAESIRALGIGSLIA